MMTRETLGARIVKNGLCAAAAALLLALAAAMAGEVFQRTASVAFHTQSVSGIAFE